MGTQIYILKKTLILCLKKHQYYGQRKRIDIDIQNVQFRTLKFISVGKKNEWTIKLI